MQGALRLDVVVAEQGAVHEVAAGVGQPLLVRGQVLQTRRRLDAHLQALHRETRDAIDEAGPARERLHDDLHAPDVRHVEKDLALLGLQALPQGSGDELGGADEEPLGLWRGPELDGESGLHLLYGLVAMRDEDRRHQGVEVLDHDPAQTEARGPMRPTRPTRRGDRRDLRHHVAPQHALRHRREEVEDWGALGCRCPSFRF